MDLVQMMSTGKLPLSVVVPCMNEEESLPEFHRRMVRACQAAGVATFEIVYFNDGATDSTRTARSLRELQSFRATTLQAIDHLNRDLAGD